MGQSAKQEKTELKKPIIIIINIIGFSEPRFGSGLREAFAREEAKRNLATVLNQNLSRKLRRS